EAEGYKERAIQHHRELTAARRERSTLSARDPLWPHGLNGDPVLDLVMGLHRIEEVQAAYLVRKAVNALCHVPCYVLAVQPVASWLKGRKPAEDRALRQRLIAELK